MSINFLLVLTFFTSSCSKEKPLLIQVKNTLNIERSYETVELSKSFLNLENLNDYGIKDSKTNTILVSQLVDSDNDGIMDMLLFQPKIASNTTNTYEIIKISEENKPKVETLCYSRFVPERTDDYAWENNRVAFRTYGPNAQYRFENNLKEGTLSSGIDAWLKRVEYPVINKWYKKYTDKTGTYHEDTGEGLDNFHVGSSRGVGGIAFKKDSIYYISKNFTRWKTLTTGPIRTLFTLDYASWDADGIPITDSKTISLDLGNNLSKFEVTIEGTNSISAGLTLHKKEGVVFGNEKENWVAYWEPIDDSEIGTTLLTTSEYFSGYETYNTEVKDLSNAYLHLKVKDNKVVYYAGFGWKKSGQFTNKQEWESYLNSFSEKLKNPLKVALITN